LTVWIAVAFVSSGYLAAKPASVRLDERFITIEQAGKEAETISWDEIAAYAYYEELTLYSLKVQLRGRETVSIIDFKWNDNTDPRAFLEQFESRLNASGAGTDVGSVERAGTFYRSKFKVVLSAGLLTVYVGLVIVLLSRKAFTSWNPVWTYYFWVLPTAFFFKMLKAR
jgi:hypothetical protein